jgi:hypothetical protein
MSHGLGISVALHSDIFEQPGATFSTGCQQEVIVSPERIWYTSPRSVFGRGPFRQHYTKPEFNLTSKREKRRADTGGEYVSSLDLENLISRYPAVSEAAAIGVPDAKWGKRPLWVIVLRPESNRKVLGERIEDFMSQNAVAGKIQKYGIPDKYMFVDEIPKTSVGKINKVQLRKQFIREWRDSHGF